MAYQLIAAIYGPGAPYPAITHIFAAPSQEGASVLFTEHMKHDAQLRDAYAAGLVSECWSCCADPCPPCGPGLGPITPHPLPRTPHTPQPSPPPELGPVRPPRGIVARPSPPGGYGPRPIGPQYGHGYDELALWQYPTLY